MQGSSKSPNQKPSEGKGKEKVAKHRASRGERGQTERSAFLDQRLTMRASFPSLRLLPQGEVEVPPRARGWEL